MKSDRDTIASFFRYASDDADSFGNAISFVLSVLRYDSWLAYSTAVQRTGGQKHAAVLAALDAAMVRLVKMVRECGGLTERDCERLPPVAIKVPQTLLTKKGKKRRRGEYRQNKGA